MEADSVLPEAAAHAYLGPFLERVPERGHLEPSSGDMLEIPIITLPNVVLFPGYPCPYPLRDQVQVQVHPSLNVLTTPITPYITSQGNHYLFGFKIFALFVFSLVAPLQTVPSMP